MTAPPEANSAGAGATSTPLQTQPGGDPQGGLHSALQQCARATDHAVQLAVQTALRILLAHAREGKYTVREDARNAVEQLINEIDRKISAQLNKVMHHPSFQRLEGTWRGLHYLVNGASVCTSLKFRVLNASKQELAHTFRQYKGAAWNQSPILQAIREQECVPAGGAPLGCLIGDYEFDHQAADVALLTDMARMAAATHCPFISAANPSLLQIGSWAELAKPRSVASTFTADEYAGWRRLRSHDSSRYVSLTLPRFLARAPYRSRSEGVEAFAFEESVDVASSADFCWSNSAYVMGAHVARNFQSSSQRADAHRSEGPGQAARTLRTSENEAELALHCLTEISLSECRERELSEVGFMPLVCRRDSDSAFFVGAKTLYQPALREQAGADARRQPCRKLPSIFATCRIAQQLKCVIQDKLSYFQSLATTQRWLSDWLMMHVDRAPMPAGEVSSAEHPLAAGEVVVDEPPERPGQLRAQFFLRPHDHPEGVTVLLQWCRNPSVARQPSCRVERQA